MQKCISQIVHVLLLRPEWLGSESFLVLSLSLAIVSKVVNIVANIF